MMVGSPYGIEVVRVRSREFGGRPLGWELGGGPTVLVIDWDEDRELPDTGALTVAVAEGQVPQASLECDLVTVRAELDGLLECIARRPGPALAAAHLLRAGSSLEREAATYSMLLSGPDFRAWRQDHRAAEPSSSGERVKVEQVRGTWVLRLARPGRHNAYDAAMREALCDALDAIEAAKPAPVVLLGEGPSFCSGGDLDEFGTAADPVAAYLVRTGRSVARRLERIRDRLVAGVHGHCIGAGLELAGFARAVIAAEETSFALPELTMGLNLGSGGSVSLPRRAGRQRVLELLLRGAAFDARSAKEWGLVDELVPAADLEPRCLEVAEALPR